MLTAFCQRVVRSRWSVLLGVNVLFGCVLCFYQAGRAAPKEVAEPFANATGQRAQMIALLKDIHAQLKEQNALLASGKLRVVAGEAAPAPGP